MGNSHCVGPAGMLGGTYGGMSMALCVAWVGSKGTLLMCRCPQLRVPRCRSPHCSPAGGRLHQGAGSWGIWMAVSRHSAYITRDVCGKQTELLWARRQQHQRVVAKVCMRCGLRRHGCVSLPSLQTLQLPALQCEPVHLHHHVVASCTGAPGSWGIFLLACRHGAHITRWWLQAHTQSSVWCRCFTHPLGGCTALPGEVRNTISKRVCRGELPDDER
jgi:hypothetical protein